MGLNQAIAEFKAHTQERSESELIRDGLATKGQLRKLKAGESFIDCDDQCWWKYRNEWPLASGWPPPLNKWVYLSNPLPEEVDQAQVINTSHNDGNA